MTIGASAQRLSTRVLLCACVAFYGCIAAAAEKTPDAPWGIEQLMQDLAQIKSAKATFVERKFMRILNAPLESSGALVYTAPAHLEKQTLRPNPETLILERDTLTIEDKVKKRRRTLSIHDYPVIWALVESMRSTLAGDLQSLKRFYLVNLEGTEQQWRLVLTPRDGGVKRYLSEIRITGIKTSLRGIEIMETEGDRSTMTITETPS